MEIKIKVETTLEEYNQQLKAVEKMRKIEKALNEIEVKNTTYRNDMGYIVPGYDMIVGSPEQLHDLILELKRYCE